MKHIMSFIYFIVSFLISPYSTMMTGIILNHMIVYSKVSFVQYTAILNSNIFVLYIIYFISYIIYFILYTILIYRKITSLHIIM